MELLVPVIVLVVFTAHYDPVHCRKQSFIYNASSRWLWKLQLWTILFHDYTAAAAVILYITLHNCVNSENRRCSEGSNGI